MAPPDPAVTAGLSHVSPGIGEDQANSLALLFPAAGALRTRTVAAPGPRVRGCYCLCAPASDSDPFPAGRGPLSE